MDLADNAQVQNIDTPVDIPAQQEKMLKQSEVNELVGRIKHDAYSKGLKDGSSQAQPSSLGGMPQLSEDQIRQLVADESQKQNQIGAAHSMLANFAQQMGTGKEKYSDFDETVASLGDLKNIPHIIQLATETGMADDVLYDLAKNPNKIASLTILSSIDPRLARVEAMKLKDSITKNRSASDSPEVAAPLSQITPSNVGLDNGKMSMKDLRRKYRV